MLSADYFGSVLKVFPFFGHLITFVNCEHLGPFLNLRQVEHFEAILEMLTMLQNLKEFEFRIFGYSDHFEQFSNFGRLAQFLVF